MRVTKKQVTFFLLLLILSCFLAGCSQSSQKIHTDETYLSGTWYYEDGTLNVGYNFFDDGTGFQFIGSTVNPIRYGIYAGYIYIIVGDDSEATPLLFSQEKNNLIIGGLDFVPVEDNPEVAESIASEISEAASSSSEQQFSISKIILYILIVGCVIAFFIFFSKLMRDIKENKKSRKK